MGNRRRLAARGFSDGWLDLVRFIMIFILFIVLGFVFLIFSDQMASISEAHSRKLFGLAFNRTSYRIGFVVAGILLVVLGLGLSWLFMHLRSIHGEQSKLLLPTSGALCRNSGYSSCCCWRYRVRAETLTVSRPDRGRTNGSDSAVRVAG